MYWQKELSKSQQIEKLKEKNIFDTNSLNSKILSQKKEIKSINIKLNEYVSKLSQKTIKNEELNEKIILLNNEKLKKEQIIKSLNNEILFKQQQINSINIELKRLKNENALNIQSANDKIKYQQQEIKSINIKLNEEISRSNQYSSQLSYITIKNEELNKKIILLNDEIKQQQIG